jgi:hypothetical protein
MVVGKDGEADLVELRNIEMLVNARTAVEGIHADEQDVLAKIAEILYSTDVSFLAPDQVYVRGRS